MRGGVRFVVAAAVALPMVALAGPPVSAEPAPTIVTLEGPADIHESSGSVTYIARIANPAPSLLTVGISVTATPGGATAGSDFVAEPAVLQFDPGDTTATFTVAIVNDTVLEPDESFVVALGAPSPDLELGTPSSITSTITANDEPETRVVEIGGPVTVAESAGVAQYIVSLDGLATETISVHLGVFGESSEGRVPAASGGDFVATSGRIQFAPGELVKTFTVAIVDDAVIEPAEYYTVLLSDPSAGLRIGTSPSVTATIEDDDLHVSSPPLDVRAERGDRFLTVFWAAPTDPGDAPISGYRVTVTPPNGAAPIVTAAAAADRSATVTGLVPGTTYSVSVRAVTASGEGLASPTFSISTQAVPLVAPSAGTVSVSAGSVVLGWTDNASGETSYRLQRATWTGTAFSRYVDVIGLPGNTITFTHATVPGLYRYRLRAERPGDSTAWLGFADANVPGTMDSSAPTNVTITLGPDGRTVSFAADERSGAQWLQVQRTTWNGTAFAGAVLLSSAAPGPFTDGPPSPGRYRYRVRHSSADGVSEWSATTELTVGPLVVPIAPSGLTAVATPGAGVAIAWSPGSGLTGQALQRAVWTGLGWGSWQTVQSLGADAVGANDVPPPGLVGYRVKVVGAGGYAFSSVVTFTNGAMPVPSVPSGLQAFRVGGSIRLTWTDTATDEVGVQVRWRPWTGAAYGPFQIVSSTAAANATSFQFVAPTLARMQIQVRTLGLTGSSAWSSPAVAPAAPA